jgi:hypothetical protein
MTLDETLADAFSRLRQAVADRAAPFRTPALATVGEDGTPEVRTVVLRSFVATARHLSVHTDARAAKHAEIVATPTVALVAWDAAARLQVRLRGRAVLHTGDAVARTDWDALPSVARKLYCFRQPCGLPLPARLGGRDNVGTEAESFANFAVIAITFDRLETLHLADEGHIRARFDFSDGTVSASWLMP